MICFYVQGGGLGHLTRVDKVIKALALDKDTIIIITPSLFTHHFPDYNFIQVFWNESVASWQKTIAVVFEKHTIEYCFIDAFPFGIKGELTSIYQQFTKIDFIYIARILQWEKYVSEINFGNFKQFSQTLITENLYKSHSKWIVENSKQIKNISLVSEEIIIPKALYESPYVIVLHSGGTKDVMSLCKRAAIDYKDQPKVIIAIFTQVSIVAPSAQFKVHKGVFGIHPYLFDALHIYTAAGFNTVLELAHFKNKHTCIPLEKMYDDQFFRGKNQL